MSVLTGEDYTDSSKYSILSRLICNVDRHNDRLEDGQGSSCISKKTMPID